jgi:hypothetical protein
MQRDVHIDVIRGAGILMIALDHLGGIAERLAPNGFVLPFATWTRVGWSSAAEFFVFFSGYLIGLVYVRTLQSRGAWLLQARAVHRAWQIYAANLLTMCLTLALLYGTALGGPTLIDTAQLTGFTGAGAATSWVAFLTLRTAPMFFEILQLYVVLLLVAPLFLLLARVSMLAAFAASLAIWMAVQLDPGVNIAAWHFNPFAWQFVFVLGMLCSVGNVFARIEALVSRKTLLLATGAFVLVALMIKGIDKAAVALPLIGPITVVGIDKMTLGPIRLLHFLISVVFVLQLMPRGARANASLPVRSVARIGRHSLECFCASTFVVYACAGVLVNLSRINTVTVLMGGVALVLALCAFAVFMEWVKSEPWRGSGVKKRAPAPESPLEPAPMEGGATNLSSLPTLAARIG